MTGEKGLGEAEAEAEAAVYGYMVIICSYVPVYTIDIQVMPCFLRLHVHLRSQPPRLASEVSRDKKGRGGETQYRPWETLSSESMGGEMT